MLFSRRDSRSATPEPPAAVLATVPPIDLAVPDGLMTATFGVG